MDKNINSKTKIIVGVPNEYFIKEHMVAATPSSVAQLIKIGLDVIIEQGAGEKSGFPDKEYEKSGASIVKTRKDIFLKANIVTQVNPPADDVHTKESSLNLLTNNQVIIGFLNPLIELTNMTELASKGVTSLAMEMIPRITRAQNMDALSSMANLAGYKAVILAANYLPHIFPLMMTASGTIRPAKVLVLGAGVAGLQAIATAKRLGAIVYGYDIRPIVKEQVESLGARFLETIPDEKTNTETKDGYAQSMSEDFYSKQRELLSNIAKETDVIITTAAIPGKKAPILINKEMVELMPEGSVIVDLAAANGGNCELTKENEIINEHNVTIIGTTKIQSAVPKDASQMYSQNITNILLEIIKDGDINIDMENPIISNIIITKDGDIVNTRIQQLIEENKQ